MVRNSTVELCVFFSSLRWTNTSKEATRVDIENWMVLQQTQGCNACWILMYLNRSSKWLQASSMTHDLWKEIISLIMCLLRLIDLKCTAAESPHPMSNSINSRIFCRKLDLRRFLLYRLHYIDPGTDPNWKNLPKDWFDRAVFDLHISAFCGSY